MNDTGFVSLLLDTIEAELCIDITRVYATGFSNGGFMSYRIGCELSDRFSAIAPVSGLKRRVILLQGLFGYKNLYGADFYRCNLTKTIPLLHIHGTTDPIVPYTGAINLLYIWESVNTVIS